MRDSTPGLLVLTAYWSELHQFILRNDERQHTRLVGVGSLLKNHLLEHYLVDFSLEHACLPIALVVITSVLLSEFTNCVQRI